MLLLLIVTVTTQLLSSHLKLSYITCPQGHIHSVQIRAKLDCDVQYKDLSLLVLSFYNSLVEGDLSSQPHSTNKQLGADTGLL